MHSLNKKSPATGDGKGLTQQGKGIELTAIFKLFSDREPKTISELAEISGFPEPHIWEPLKNLLREKMIESAGTKICSVSGLDLTAYALRKEADND